MKNLTVFDPPMCCNTGVCGPNPDVELVRFQSDLLRLSEQGVEVRRYNLSQEPEAFVRESEVHKLLTERGVKNLSKMESPWLDKVARDLARQVVRIPWQAVASQGREGLAQLL